MEILDLQALQTLDTVVAEGSLARAARRLHRVQSAVSYQLRRLELQFGTPLLERGGYRLGLTPAGAALLVEGRKLLAQAQHLQSLAQQFQSGWEPRLALVVDGILPLEDTLRALRALADERVPTRVQVKVEFLLGVQYRFTKDQADLMLVKDFLPHPDLAADPLPEVECVLCVSRTHPLSRSRAVTLAELQSHVELSVQDSSEQGDDRHMFGGERVFYLSGFMAKRQALLMGLGFGWMPRYLVESDLKRGRLRELRYEGGSRYRFTPQLVWRRDRPLGRAGMRLAELLRC